MQILIINGETVETFQVFVDSFLVNIKSNLITYLRGTHISLLDHRRCIVYQKLGKISRKIKLKFKKHVEVLKYGSVKGTYSQKMRNS